MFPQIIPIYMKLLSIYANTQSYFPLILNETFFYCITNYTYYLKQYHAVALKKRTAEVNDSLEVLLKRNSWHLFQQKYWSHLIFHSESFSLRLYTKGPALRTKTLNTQIGRTNDCRQPIWSRVTYRQFIKYATEPRRFWKRYRFA